jgi:hypothetical protein
MLYGGATMLDSPAPPVVLEVDGCTDVLDESPQRALALADLLLEARTTLVEPWWPVGDAGAPAAAAGHDWGPPGTRWSGLHAAAPGAWQGVYERFTADGWEKQRKRWAAGELQILGLVGHQLDDEGYPEPGGRAGWGTAIDRELPFAGAAVRLRVWVHPPVYGEEVAEVVRDRWVPFARHATALLEGVSGYLTVDHAGDASPYEDWHGVPIQTVDVTRTVRGPYWGTLLGHQVRAAVDMEAIVALRDVTVQDAGEGTWVWLPGDVDDPDVDLLRRLRDLLGPVLPEGMDDWTYYGLPLRIATLG